MPIAGLDSISIFNAYKMLFDVLTSKRFKPKINIMDNQATKDIKAFLMEQQCKLQLVEPHNHRMNAAARAIQTFKDASIATLATMDSEFPLQSWGKNHAASSRHTAYDASLKDKPSYLHL
jgi:hypothetical protein